MIGLRAYLMGGAAAVVMALAVAAWWGWHRVGVLREDNARLERSVAALEQAAEQAREAARVANAWRMREAARAAQMDASIEALLTGEFADADLVLDPRIGRYLECLHTGNTDACSGGAD